MDLMVSSAPLASPHHSVTSTCHSSTLDSSSDFSPVTCCAVAMNSSKTATVEQDVPSKVPVLTPGDISPATMCEYKHACIGYFENKDIVPDKQVRKILSGIKDDRIKEWLSVDRAHIQTLSFEEFMVEFCASFLPDTVTGRKTHYQTF